MNLYVLAKSKINSAIFICFLLFMLVSKSSFGQSIRIGDANNIYLRSSDNNHGLGYYGAPANKLFNGVDVNGPVLYGWSGGGLGIHRYAGPSSIVLTWKETGYVGIGTASPELKLDIRGDDSKIGLANSAAWDHMYMFHDGATAFFRAGGAESGLAFQVGSGGSGSYGGQTYIEAMRLLGNGNVGIGITNPTKPLSFANTLASKISLWSTPDGAGILGFGVSAGQLNYHVNSTGDNHVFYAGGNNGNGTELIRIQGTGNVGIGTTSPSYKLQVTGDIYANGGWLRVAGNQGLHFESYGGGFYMIDNTWIRTYGNKNFYHNTGIMRTDGQLQVGDNGNRFVVNNAGNVGIGTTSPIAKLTVSNGTMGLSVFPGYLDGTTNNAWTTLDMPGLQGLRVWDNFSVSNNVGIGTTSPTQKLQVEGNSYFNGTVGIGTAPVPDIALKVQGSFDVSSSSTNTIFHVSTGKGLVFVGDSAYDQYTSTGGATGTSVIQDGAFSLWVSKGIVSEDLALVDVTDWSDFVFEKDYKLRSLEEVAAYITTHGHLPEMPSEAEVKAQGYSVHDINKKLLQKIEELTLYTIQQEAKAKAQAIQLEAQQKQFNSLEQRIKQLEDKQ